VFWFKTIGTQKTNMSEEMIGKTFKLKATKMFCFLPYIEPTEMLRGDFFHEKTQEQYPANQREEIKRKAFKLKNHKSYLLSAIHRTYRNAERCFFGDKRQVPSKPM